VADVGPEGGLLSVKLVDVVDGSAAVVLAAGEVGVAGVVAVEVVCWPEQAARVSAAKEEIVRTVRRLTDCFSEFIRA